MVLSNPSPQSPWDLYHRRKKKICGVWQLHLCIKNLYQSFVKMEIDQNVNTIHLIVVWVTTFIIPNYET